MLGRQNKHLVIRLLKVNAGNIYHIIVTRKRSHGNSRLDRIGSIASKSPYAFLKLDIKKLTKYLLEKNVVITECVWKMLNLDIHLVEETQKQKIEETKNRRINGILKK